jgi:hypothetical protein
MQDAPKRLTVMTALRSAEFWLLLVAVVLSAFQQHWWVIVPLTVAGLAISSLPKYLTLWPRAEAVGAQHAWWLTVALSLLNSLAATCGCLLLGRVLAWLWF